MMSIDRQEDPIGDRWTIACGAPVKKSIVPPNQRELNI